MNKYDELDAAILARIKSGYGRFYEIWPACRSIPAVLGAKVDRAVDRRLQALKKQGKIACSGQRWYTLG